MPPSALALRALAHPLRVHILELLSRHGPQTSSTIGKMVEQPSGVTSYHLRQLARHGYIQEVEGKGHGRERWWERVQGSVDFYSPDYVGSKFASQALQSVAIEFARQRLEALTNFLQANHQCLGPEWDSVGTIRTRTLRLSAEQTKRLTKEVDALIAQLSEEFEADQETALKHAVQLHFDAFPIVLPDDMSPD